MLTLRTGRPVRLELTRDEELSAARTRHPQILHLKSGVRDGKFTAIEMRVLENTGAYGTHALTVMSVTGNRALSLYRCPNLRYEARAVYTNLAVAGAFRGYGCPQGFFALESHVDEIAHALGEDALEFRRRNHVVEGDDQPIAEVLGEGKEGFKQLIRSCGLPQAIELGAKAIGWKEKRPAAPAAAGAGLTAPRRRDGHRHAGVGNPGRRHGRGLDQDERGRLVQPADGRHRHRHRLGHDVLPGRRGSARRRGGEDHPLLVRHRHDAVRSRRLRLVHDLHLGARGGKGGPPGQGADPGSGRADAGGGSGRDRPAQREGLREGRPLRHLRPGLPVVPLPEGPVPDHGHGVAHVATTRRRRSPPSSSRSRWTPKRGWSAS